MSETLKSRRFSISFSGVKTTVSPDVNYEFQDGQMKVDYAYLISSANEKVITEFNKNASPEGDGYIPYSKIFNLTKFTIKDDPEAGEHSWKEYGAFMLNFNKEDELDLSPDVGMYTIAGITANNYSIYRREYEVFGEDSVYDREAGKYVYNTYKEIKGDWKPVIINSHFGELRDFNIDCDKTYQYILYPSKYLDNGLQDTGEGLQIFANYDKIIAVPQKDSEGHIKPDKYDFIPGSQEVEGKVVYPYAQFNGHPVSVNWQDWSIIELIPEENEKNVPVVKKTYKANLDQMWFFKYALETGSQTQNISRNEFQTLGQFPKIGFGESNYISGEVTAMLGSEIRPYRGDSYVERIWENRGAEQQVVTTNERALMLKQWRALVASKNPKLLRDMKGQSWIVQIMSGSNTPKNFVKNQPDTISFQWKQVESTENVIIYGDITPIPTRCNEKDPVKEKTPIFKENKY